jgi:WD40 repeat protein
MSQSALQIATTNDAPDERREVVFLCHNSKDKEFIKQIADALELEFGTKFFLDVFAIPAGEAFIPWIENALADCAGCAIFMGGNGWGPTHLWEAELALARYRRDTTFKLIPVALPGISIDETSKLGSGTLFQEINWADFTKGADAKDSLEKLEGALTGRMSPGYRGPARLTPYQVRRDSERWTRSGSADRSILYRGKQLLEAQTMLQENPDFLQVDGVVPFLTASQERQNSFWRRAAVGAAAASVVLLTATVVAIASYVVAEQRRSASLSRQLAMVSKDAAGADRALLIGARALLISDTPEAGGALLEQLQEKRFLRRMVGTGVYVEAAIAGSGDGFFLGRSNGGLLALSPNDNSAFPVALTGPEGVTAVAASETELWLGREDGRVDVVGENGRRTLIQAASKVSPGRERRVRTVAHDGASGLVAAGTGSGRIVIVRTSDGRVIQDLDEGEDVRINSLSFDPKRKRLVAGTSAGTIAVIDTKTFRITERYPKIDGGVLALDFLDDGSLVAVGGQGRLLFFDGRDPAIEKPRNGDVVPFAVSAAIDRKSARVAIGDKAGVVRLYDAATGQGTGLEPLRAHSDTVTAVAFGRGKNDLISASSNGTVAVWELAGNHGPARELPQLNLSPSVLRTDEAGTLVAASSSEAGAKVWRMTGEKWETVLDLVEATRRVDDSERKLLKTVEKGSDKGFTDVGTSVVPSVAMDSSGAVIAWSTIGGAVLFLPLKDPSANPTVLVAPGRLPAEDIAVSGNGRLVAALEAGGAVVSVTEVEESSGPKRSSVILSAPARSVAVDEEGRRLAVGLKSGDIAQYSKGAIWKPIGKPWNVHASEVAGLQYSADGRRIISYGSGGGGTDRTVAVSRASGVPDPRLLQSMQAAGSVSAMATGLTRGLLAVGDGDGQVLTWSSAERRYSGRLTTGTTYVSAVMIDDERGRLVTANGDGSILSWSLDPADWVALACTKANRTLRRDEWQELLPDDPYVQSCSAGGGRTTKALIPR